ncbi:MAG: hypothetical protein ACRDQ1_00660 [Sciscionella sp.]
MRVIVCDDQPVYRDWLQLLLEELGAANRAQAVALARDAGSDNPPEARR